MNESRAIALWAATFCAGFVGILALRGELSPIGAESLEPAAVRPPSPPAQAANQAPPARPANQTPPARPVEPIVPPSMESDAAAPSSRTLAPPAAPASPVPNNPAPRLPPPARASETAAVPGVAGDNAEARHYTDALNLLSYEGYSGVESIAPAGARFRATAIMEDRRVDVLVDPATGTVRPLGSRR